MHSRVVGSMPGDLPPPPASWNVLYSKRCSGRPHPPPETVLPCTHPTHHYVPLAGPQPQQQAPAGQRADGSAPIAAPTAQRCSGGWAPRSAGWALGRGPNGSEDGTGARAKSAMARHWGTRRTAQKTMSSSTWPSRTSRSKRLRSRCPRPRGRPEPLAPNGSEDDVLVHMVVHERAAHLA